jgi:hypothetical protein
MPMLKRFSYAITAAIFLCLSLAACNYYTIGSTVNPAPYPCLDIDHTISGYSSPPPQVIPAKPGGTITINWQLTKSSPPAGTPIVPVQRAVMQGQFFLQPAASGPTLKMQPPVVASGCKPQTIASTFALPSQKGYYNLELSAVSYYQGGSTSTTTDITIHIS